MIDIIEKNNIANNIELIEDNVEDIPFPQANSFEIVIKTLELVYSDVNTASLISQWSRPMSLKVASTIFLP